jgi:hypothetical protein
LEKLYPRLLQKAKSPISSENPVVASAVLCCTSPSFYQNNIHNCIEILTKLVDKKGIYFILFFLFFVFTDEASISSAAVDSIQMVMSGISRSSVHVWSPFDNTVDTCLFQGSSKLNNSFFSFSQSATHHSFNTSQPESSEYSSPFSSYTLSSRESPSIFNQNHRNIPPDYILDSFVKLLIESNIHSSRHIISGYEGWARVLSFILFFLYMVFVYCSSNISY